MKIAVTITRCIQTGMEEWTNYPQTKIFDSSQSIDDMLKWSEKYRKNFSVSDLKMSPVED